MRAKGSSMLARTRSRRLSTEVTYTRGNHSVVVLAAIGSTPFERNEDNGIVQELRIRDFMIDAEVLILNGVLMEPQSGDRILETIEGRTYTWEVMPTYAEQSWVWSDPYKTTYRIHTKEVGESI